MVKLYGPVEFTHKLHAEMSQMGGGCGECHHYTLGNETPPCGQCHRADEASSSLLQPGLKGAYHRKCLDCHATWDSSNDCSKCHTVLQASERSVRATGGSGPKPTRDPIEAEESFYYQTSHVQGAVVSFHHQDHALRYGLDCSDCHVGSTCADCHDTDEKAVSHIDRTGSCFTCHNEQNCQLCHSKTKRASFNHGAKTGWALESYHARLNCSECHGTSGKYDKAKSTCASCHSGWTAGSFNHAVTGLSLNEAHREFDCELCHGNSEFDKAPVCGDCHDDVSFPASLPGKRIRQ
ncbi:cytochrome c3 family protein [candidate division KSB1 bacterium]